MTAIAPDPPATATGRGGVDGDNEERRRGLAQLARQRLGRRLAGYTDQGYRVGESRKDCRVPDSVVQQVRALHEDNHWGPVQIARALDLKLEWVRKVCRYQRRASVAAIWKRLHADDQAQEG